LEYNSKGLWRLQRILAGKLHQRMTHEDVDLVLKKINCQIIIGFDVVPGLRHDTKPKLAHIPIIAITANALKGDAENALAAGCDVYMSKPINIHELRARVEGFMSPLNEEMKQAK
jgi:CheY-like chemotaxis protein